MSFWDEAAPTKEGRRSTGLWRELRIGQETCLGRRGSKSSGWKGNFAACESGEKKETKTKKKNKMESKDGEGAMAVEENNG